MPNRRPKVARRGQASCPLTKPSSRNWSRRIPISRSSNCAMRLPRRRAWKSTTRPSPGCCPGLFTRIGRAARSGGIRRSIGATGKLKGAPDLGAWVAAVLGFGCGMGGGVGRCGRSDRRHARQSLEQEAHDGRGGTCARQVQGDAGFHLDDAGGDLDQAQAQRVELGAPPGRALWARRRAGSTSASRRRRAGTAGAGWRWRWCRRFGRRRGGSSTP